MSFSADLKNLQIGNQAFMHRGRASGRQVAPATARFR
jgi:hypothetical protein